MPAAESPYEIRCAKCERWFSAPVFLGGVLVLDKQSLIGSFVGCPQCGTRIACTINNVRDREVEEEDLVAKFRDLHRQPPAPSTAPPVPAAPPQAPPAPVASPPRPLPSPPSAPATTPAPSQGGGKSASRPDLAVEVRCDQCRRWFSAPIRVGEQWILSKESILGAYIPCGLCGARVACNIDNVRERGLEEDRLGPVLGL